MANVKKEEDLPSSPSTFGRPSLTPTGSGSLNGHANSSAEYTTELFVPSPQQVLQSVNTSAWDAHPGELWLSLRKDEEPWPVVICDEEILETLSQDQRRPANARQKDGSWRTEYGPDGRFRDQRCFPTLRLGLDRKLCWTPWKCLKPIELIGEDIKDSTDNPDLLHAYAEVNEQFGRNDLSYWKDKLLAQRLATPEEPKLLAQPLVTSEEPKIANTKAKPDTMISPRKRRMGRNGFRYPPKKVCGVRVWGKGRDVLSSGDDEEDVPKKKVKLEEDDCDLSLESQSTVKHEPLQGAPSAEARSRPTEQLLTPLTSPIKPESISTSASVPGQSSDDHCGPDLDPADLSPVKLYVGSPNTVFSVEASALDLSSHLRTKLSQDLTLGRYVMSPFLATIDPKDFEPIAVYLNNKMPDSPYAQYFKIIGGDSQKPPPEHARRIVMIIRIARILGLTLFEEAVVEMCSYAYIGSDRDFLAMIEEILKFDSTEDQPTRKHCVRWLAQSFWEFALLDSLELRRVMLLDDRILREVLETLASLMTERKAAQKLAGAGEGSVKGNPCQDTMTT